MAPNDMTCKISHVLCDPSRPGKQIWEKKWVVLRKNKIYIYEKDITDDLTPLDDFDLCPANGEVTVHSSVSPTELTNTASSDLPYVLRLEFEPDTTCWPGRWGMKHIRDNIPYNSHVLM